MGYSPSLIDETNDKLYFVNKFRVKRDREMAMCGNSNSNSNSNSNLNSNSDKKGMDLASATYSLPPSTEETDDEYELLRGLKATVKCCQQLQEKLHLENSKVKPSHSRVEMTDPKKFQSISEENIRLRSVIQDVTEANKRWQKYNEERQEFIQRILATNKELKSQSEVKTTAAISNDASAMTDEELTSLKLSLNKAIEGKRKAEKEIEDLKKKLAQLTMYIERTKNEHKEFVQLLEIQVQAHKDDWAAEKHEKTQALESVSSLKEQLQAANAKVHQLERAVLHCDPSSCHMHNGLHTEPILRSPPRRHRPSVSQRPVANSHSELIPRSPSGGSRLSAEEVVSDGVNRNSFDLVSEFPLSSTPSSSSSAFEGIGGADSKDALQCPGCGKVFAPEVHLQFLNHFDDCQINQRKRSQPPRAFLK